MSTLYQELPVKLSAQEHYLKAKELSRKISEVRALQVEKKLLTSELGAKLKKLNEEVFTLSDAVESGKEKRKILCKERFNEADRMIETVRLDTTPPEVVARRPLKDADRQGKLPGTGGEEDDSQEQLDLDEEDEPEEEDAATH